MSDFMDMLKAKWKSGEMATQGNPVRAGDVIIAKFSESEYRIVDNSHLLTGRVPFEYRVLERAVQKPDWADAPAVRITVDGEHHYVLKTERFDEDEPDIYGYDDNEVAWYYDAVYDEVVPLVPQETADKMIERALQMADNNDWAGFERMTDAAMNAVLGD